MKDLPDLRLAQRFCRVLTFIPALDCMIVQLWVLEQVLERIVEKVTEWVVAKVERGLMRLHTVDVGPRDTSIASLVALVVTK